MKKGLLGFGVLMLVSMAASTMAQAPAPAFQPVGTVRQIMLGIVAPSSDVLFKVPSQAPKDDKEWKTVQDSTLMLAEAGNLLLMPGRAKDNGDWTKFAKALIDQGSKAFKAANAKDAKSLEDIGNDVDQVCEDCHAKYLPKPAQ
jgi:hypothetical protein